MQLTTLDPPNFIRPLATAQCILMFGLFMAKPVNLSLLIPPPLFISSVLFQLLQVLVAAFAVSGYSSTYFRAGSKPFNPLLGETYECIREDKGFCFFSEQVHLCTDYVQFFSFSLLTLKTSADRRPAAQVACRGRFYHITSISRFIRL